MNVSELYDLTFWITENIVSTQIPEKYQALQGILQQHTRPGQPKITFEEQKNDLFNAIKKVPLRSLTLEPNLFLHRTPNCRRQ